MFSNKHSNYLIIGLSGCTNGGKTTLTKLLNEYFAKKNIIPQILHMDDYFLTDTSRLTFIPEVQTYNYDVIESLDVEKYFNDAMDIIKKFESNSKLSKPEQILILDGFLLFNIPKLLNLCHLRYFYTLPYDICKHRRETRVFDPPDVPKYFDLIAWPSYLKFKIIIEEIKSDENIKFLDGTQNKKIIFEIVLKDIEDKLK